MKKLFICVICAVIFISGVTLSFAALKGSDDYYDISGVWMNEKDYPPDTGDTFYRIRKFGDEYFVEPFREDNVRPMPDTYRIKVSGNVVEAMVTEDKTRLWTNGRIFTHVASGFLSDAHEKLTMEYTSTMPTGAVGDRVNGWREIPVTVTWVRIGK